MLFILAIQPSLSGKIGISEAGQPGLSNAEKLLRLSSTTTTPTHGVQMGDTVKTRVYAYSLVRGDSG